MSDDEDYFEDEWEPMYDDGFGAQADDLAEHSLPSPPYLDYDSEGADNLNESDMEGEVLEYLDFYYDDDPTLMNNRNGLENPPISRKKRKAADGLPHTKKKRKTGTSQGMNNHPAEEDAKLKGRGIIWKVEDRNELPTHEPGKGEKVALLKDWRNLFEVPEKEGDNRSMQPTLVARGRESKKRKVSDSNDLDDTPAPGKSTKAPQLARGSRSRRTRSSPKPSPLKHSLSSTDLPNTKPNGPRKKPKSQPPGPNEGDEDSLTPAAPATKKRRNQDDEENDSIDSKRRAISGKMKDDTASRSVLSTRQTRSRNAGGP